MKKLPVFATLGEGCKIGLLNFFSLLGAAILYFLTIWIPYLNVGTTIAMASLPAELAKGKMINPTFIFESKYRRNMGEFLILYTLMSGAICTGMLFGIIPGFVIAIAWNYALVLFVDKDLNALESLRESNRITYGNKARMFGIVCLFVLFFYLIIGIVALAFVLPSIDWLAVIGIILIIILSLILIPISFGIDASMYRQLLAEDPKAEVKEAIVAEPKAASPKAAKKPAAKKPAAKKPAEAPAKKPAAKKAPAKKAPAKKAEK
jgi:hypothetical protein